MYRDNPFSVVHDKDYYGRLIENIGRILVEGAQRIEVPAVAAERIGRAEETHAAHYRLIGSDGAQIRARWFDYDLNRILPEAFS